eukprot:CAMPEP_0168283756 /NCGR_PEP_ID=MMETSP0141_2-20121125/23122_1 /TAXON_ID=44445 /ORGANISM="Pseudo-nitzschia australis, Strain 10249 10 AB" /LENGTH=137 /DNA_ID=CAMNT_0008227673 /DNA_START=168 /DNA_END=581 /DNA_ORIENTATION=+
MHQRKNTNGHSNSNMYSRSGSGGYGRDVEDGGRFNDANTNILEQQNNDRISELSEQVARLKGLTVDIGTEVREQNSFLEKMGEGFLSTGDMLQSSLGRIGIMLDTSSGKHMCYMILFVVSVVVFLYWMMTHKGQSGA